MITASSSFLTANAAMNKSPIYLIEIAGYSRAFTNRVTGVGGQYDWISSIDNLPITINDLDGGADLGGLAFTVQDRGNAITGDFPGFVFEGKVVTLKTGFPGMLQSDFVLLFTGTIDHVDSANSNNDYYFTCIDNKTILNQVIYTLADDGFPTSSSHIKTVSAHPLDILLNILSVQLGLSSGAYDGTKIASYRDSIFSGTQFVFNIDSPPAAKDFIEQQLMKPLGGYLWTDNLGRITVNFAYPQSITSVFSITEDAIIPVPEAQQSDLINTISFRVDKDSSGNFLNELVENYAPSISKYGQYGQTVIESDGMRTSLQAFFLAALTSQMIFRRYGMKNLKFDTIDVFWNAVVLEPGDLVSVSHSKIPNRASGTIGIAGKLFIVMNRLYDFTNCVVQLLLLDADYLTSFKTFKIAPNGKPDYPSATTGDKAAYMFMCNNSDQYSTGAAANTLG